MPARLANLQTISLNTYADVIRKVVDLNVRYYSCLGRLTTDYLRELIASIAKPGTEFAASTDSAASARATAANKPQVTMVLEAEPGAVAQGVFLVENHLDTDVDSPVLASGFKDSAGVEIRPLFKFDPPQIVLKRREQILVRVTVRIGDDIKPDTRYVGQFSIPGLRGTSIPVVLRSRKTL